MTTPDDARPDPRPVGAPTPGMFFAPAPGANSGPPSAPPAPAPPVTPAPSPPVAPSFGSPPPTAPAGPPPAAPPPARAIAVPQQASSTDFAAANNLFEPDAVPFPDAPVREALGVQIGLWGSSRSGKSTYLAALPVAAEGRAASTFRVTPTSDDALAYMQESVNQLVVTRRFPNPTRVNRPISWRFQGTVPETGLMKLRRRERPVEFTLEVYDAPGNFMESGALAPLYMTILANSRGLIYLLDPLSDPREDVAFNGFYEALGRIKMQLQQIGQLLPDGRLRHYVAVCVTKFDSERVVRGLVPTGLVDSHGPTPRIPDHKAKAYFDWVCDHLLGNSATLVRNSINANFAPDRVKYFATSATGFRLNRNQTFDYRDFQNAGGANGDEVRDVVRPINVLEPLLFLEESIRLDQHR